MLFRLTLTRYTAFKNQPMIQFQLKVTRILFCFSFVVLVALSCSNDEAIRSVREVGEQQDSSHEEILFVGNSHTYYNSGIAYHLSRFRSYDDLDYEPFIKDASLAGYRLSEHLTNDATLSKINERDWEVIVFQENSFYAANDGATTVSAMEAFAEMLSQKNTKIYLFMTWAYKDRPEMYDPIYTTNENAAQAAGATLVEVGRVWRSIVQEGHENIELYNEDGYHPGLQGTFLAASMFYKALFGKNPSDNPYNPGLEVDQANYLKQKAN